MFTLFLPDIKQSYQNQALFGEAAAVSPSCTLSVMVIHVLGLRGKHLCSGDRGRARETGSDQAGRSLPQGLRNSLV